MLQPLSDVLREKREKTWEEADVRHFIQRWLRSETRIEQIYCERFSGGVATVRCPSPAVRAAVKLFEYDLGRALTETSGVSLTQLVVTQ